MRRFLILLLVALPISAQQLTYDTAIRVEMRDGRVESVPLPLAPTANVIVEFRDAPMAKLAVRSASAALASYATAFQRFRVDVAAVEGAEVRWEYFRTFNGAAVRVPRAGVAKLAALPYVKAVHPGREVHTLQEFTAPVNVKQVKADEFWSTYGTRGAGVVIAIIDTGVDYTHPAIAGHFGGGYDFVNKDNDPMDDHFHGTHVAGIAAGNTDALQGVAPEATLIAFKVLGATGSGSDADVLAGIERTVDPNGDGDTRDRVDVANLSLGGGGGPDDPLSVAVDNASALGVVFAIAAGNSGGGHTISSPGTARSAITVGAVDRNDVIASFSSRGPNMKDLAVKPEVCAPGVSVVSSVPGGGYGSLSGTSMATPHVAGVAALLRAVHRDWTPARIKAALIASTSNVADEVMATGSGRIDVVSAASVTIGADPPSLSFGLDSPTLTTFTATRTVRLTNGNSFRAPFTFTVAAKAGEKVTFDPPSFSLDPGESKDVNVTVEVTNAAVKTGAATFSGGGDIVVRNGGGRTLIPFGYVKAARATTTFDSGSQQTLWFGPQLFAVAAGLDDRTSEALLAPGTYDYFVYDFVLDAKTGAFTDQRIVYREAQAIDGDVKIDIAAGAAPHLVTFAGRDENGVLLSSSRGYISWGRLFLHPNWPVVSLHLPALPIASMHASDLSLPKLAVTEGVYDWQTRHVAIVNQPLVTPLGGDVTLTAGGAGLSTADLRLFNSPGLAPFLTVTTTPQIKGTADDAGTTLRTTLRNPGEVETSLRLAMNAPAVDGYGANVVVSGGADNFTWYTTPAIVHSGGKMTVAPAPKIADGFNFAFGFGPLLPSGTFGTITPVQGLFNQSVTGQAGEGRPVDAGRVVSELYAPDGTLVVRGFGTASRLLPFSNKTGMFRLDMVTQGLLYGGVPRTTTLSLGFDPSKADPSPPAIATVALLDGAGNLTRLIEPNGAGSLRFSVTGGDAKKVSYRAHGKTEWIPIAAAQQTAEIYLVNLGALAHAGRALYDVKIETADGSGNTATLTYEPAFSVGTEVPPRGRAAGK
jgi:subtilisin family serine protease